MDYDLMVLGGGPAGSNAAQRAAAAGMKVAVVERATLGGTCLNEGCIPTKSLLYSAKLLDNAAAAAKYGVHAEGLMLDHAAVMARKTKVVRTLVAGMKAALKNAGAEVILGEGTLAAHGPEGFMVAVDGREYTARRVLLACGSKTAVPPIPGLAQGLEDGFAITSREALSLDAAPGRLVVVGAGVIGLELASYYRSAGSEVCVVEMQDKIGGEADAELCTLLQKELEKKGIQFYLGAMVEEVRGATLQFYQAGRRQQYEADLVLLATGRMPHAAGLGLERLGLTLEKGAVPVDAHMATALPGLYAAGDITGRSMLAHTAYREGEVAVHHMLGIPDEMDYTTIPAVVYTNPELACVGESENSARARGLDVQVVKLPMRFSGRYLIENEGGNGLFKLVVEKESRRVLGAHALANASSEFIVAAGACITAGMTVQDMQKVVFPHPTVGEIIREALFKAEEEAEQ